MSVREEDRHTFYAGKPQPCRDSPGHIETVDPSTATPICKVHTSSPASIDAAVKSAQDAFPSWSRTPPAERARVLQRAVALLREHNDALARVETLDTGKPLSETEAVDIATGADVLEFFAGLVAGGGLHGETIRLRPTATAYTTKEPLGVCAGIGAWNYPIQIALWKSAPCLAAGNCMVYKPSEYTPLHAEYLAEIYRRAGLPDGAFNVVYGAGDVGARLAAHPAVAKVSFTGQVSTGRKVAAAAAGGMKYVTMELGGKSPLVVLPDADAAAAADVAMMANFYSSGQVCTNGTRVFVPRALRRDFEAAVRERVERHVRPGDPRDPATNFGPLSSAAHRDKVLSYIRRGVEEDRATLLCGGLAEGGDPGDPAAAELLPPLPREGPLKRGYWVRPTVFTDCADGMAVVREEIFGPVMCVLYYDGERGGADEAVRRANATELGLAAGVVGRDVDLCHATAARLEAGIAWINTWGESPAEMAVGGWKQSGVGVENGRRGLEAWVRSKSTLVEMGGSVPTVFAKL